MTRNTFQELLQEAGCVIDEYNNRPIVFISEPVLFRRELSLKIRSDPQYPDNLDEFFDSMNAYLQDVDVLRRFLLPATLSDHLMDNRRTSILESAIKTLLNIDIIQPTLITYLLERLPEFYDELENDNSSSCTARLILHQLRWSEYIVAPQALTGKLIEIIQITPTVIQHEIITSLPDIINDSEHKPIVVYLKELMHEDAELTVPILDALSNLTLHSESLEDVRDTVLDRLESAELDDLAVIIKFLLQTVKPHTIDLVILGIREKLDFRSLGKSTIPSITRKAKHSPEALILESIKLGLQFHKFVCDSWIKSIAALQTKPAHKIIDVLVLFILYSMTSTKKKADQIFRKKIADGLITSSLLEESIMHHGHGLASYWNTILSLSESLLRSSQQQSVLIPSSKALYISAFKSSDVYYRQEIIGSLVTHIGSGSATEMDVALDTLLHLARTDVDNMAVYDVFIKGILDYLDNLTLPQIRTLFNIFSLLSVMPKARKEGDSGLWSEICIVIRKQLSNPREKYKKIGVIASLAAVNVLTSAKLCASEDESGAGSSSTQREMTSDDAHRHPLIRQAIQMVEMALQHCHEYPVCLAMVYDELAYMLEHGDMDKRMQLYIAESITGDFIEQYVADAGAVEERITRDANRLEVPVKPQNWMNLDGQDAAIAIDFYSFICDNDERKKKRSVLTLCALFNLLQSSEKLGNNGSLDGIDALVGCGLVLFNHTDFDDDMVKELKTHDLWNACDIIYYAINWCRELLNVFSVVCDQSIHQKTVQRVKNVLMLESALCKFIKQASGYAPMEFYASLPMAGLKNSTSRTLTISSAVSVRDSPGVDDTSDTEPKPARKDKTNTNVAFNSIDALRPHMRALNINVLSVLAASENLPHNEDKLDNRELSYIFKDLNEKLKNKIVPAPVSAFGRKKQVDQNLHSTAMLSRISAPDLVKQVIKYLPSILQRLEGLYEDIQLHDTQAGRIGSSSQTIVQCTSLIMNIIFKLVSWPEIENPEHRDILEDLVKTLASRIVADESQHDTFEVTVREVFKYLAHFSNNIPDATTAIVLYKTLMRVMVLSDNDPALKVGAHQVVTRILATDWFDWRDIKKQIIFLVGQAIELDKDPLQALHTYVNQVLPQYNEEGRLEDHPLLRDDTVIYYYEAMINQAVKALHLLQETDDNDNENDNVLDKTEKLVRIFASITTYIKKKDKKELFSVLLKTGRAFIEQFTMHSIPYFTGVFKYHKERIVVILKNFQSCTRMLQIICSHVKVMKDIKLSSYVPKLKQAMETVIFQVKILLTENNAPADAFFLGALKHRDIRGAEVSSQMPRDLSSSESEAEENEENLEVAVAARSQAKRKRKQSTKPTARKSRAKATEDEDRTIRTTSQVPTTDDEGDDELAGDDDEGEDTMDIDLNSTDEEEQQSASARDRGPHLMSLSPPPIHGMQNSVASVEQIELTPSRKDGIPEELEESLRNFGCEFIQSAGILLKLPQVAMATAQVLFQRFYYMASLKDFGIVEIGMGALFLASKVEESFTRLTYMVSVYDCLLKRARKQPTYPPLDAFSQQAYDLKNMIITGEMQILKRLGFNVHVELPYGLMINYLRILGLEEDEKVAGKAWNYLNDGLRSNVYATYEPATIACAAIWLACRDHTIKLPPDWYLLFDTEYDNVTNAAGQVRRVYYTKIDRERLPLYADEMDAWLARNCL
ncbi:Fanconi anemia protein FancD2 nuclease-domain-containing protein [Zychaea mexicana]|uniref:Fanconi anemia protein FancD2 nuclease-domain-containing protein n=1 Tax=Zychaea mexicana TaxID=64656 RepID=UPI0022FEE580|nr:Fanconi anemia protein FancD2 nuclease-domain-containing protein [Zychaea mexicana]KAI9475361.1 Fanconi anemia protein FancD2 nuclease-domain-containing protein [Zychaea mexicana]